MFNENNPLAMQRELTGVTNALSGANVHTTFQGDGAYATNNCVNVPSMKLDAVLSRVVQRMMRGYHIHEVSHVQWTDHALWNSEPREPHERRCWNAMEDVFIERKANQNYAGALRNLSTTVQVVLARENVMFKGHRRAASELSYVVLQWARQRMHYNSPALDEYLLGVPTWLKEAAEPFVDLALACDSTRETLDLSNIINAAVATLESERAANDAADDREQGDPQEGDGADGADGGDGGDQTKDEGSDGDDGDEQDEADGGGGSQGDGGEGGSSEQEGGGQGDGEATIAGFGEDMNAVADALSQMLKDEGATSEYDDYGCGNDTPNIGCETTSWKEISEDRWPESNGAGSARRQTRLDLYDADVKKLGKKLRSQAASLGRSLLAQERRAWHGGKTEGRLDRRRMGAVVGGSQEIFAEQVVQRGANVGLTVMMDASGSMDFDYARRSLVALNEALTRTMVQYRIVWWASGSNNCVAKTSAMRGGSGDSKYAIGCTGEWSGGTRPLPAILPEYAHLVGTDVDRRILLFCTDGQYTKHEAKGLSMYRAEAMRKFGVETYGLFIGSHGANKDVWDTIYGREGWVESNSRRLAETVLNGVENMLRSGGRDIAA